MAHRMRQVYAASKAIPYMDDEHFSTANDRLVAVMDGHGSSAVSRYS